MSAAAALACLLSLLLAPVGCSRPETPAGKGLERIRAAGVLRWGGDTQGGEPYVYDDPAKPGHLVGFEVELAAAIARELGVRSEFVQNDWSNLVPSLERGTFDIVMNGLEVTDARTGRVLFTRPYYVFAERLMVRSEDAPKMRSPDVASLKGKRVGTLSNSLAFEMLRGTADTVIYEGVEEPYTDLLRGRTDAVLLDDIIATRYGVTKAGLEVVGDLRDGYYAIAVRPSEPEVKAAIDEALGRIAARGELRKILEGSHIWNARQERLASWSAADQAEMLGQPPPPPAFGPAHVVLFLKGAAITLLVSVLAMAIAVPLGLFLALVRMYGGPAARFAASAYVEVYRGTPVLLQLYLLYYGLAPVLKLGALTAAVVGLGMNYAAYEAEVYRAGMQAVPKAQMEAALALGMTTRLALRRVVLPQAVRHAIPNVTNDFIALLKDSSLVSVITVVELTKQMTITAIDVRTWLGPGLTCAALYFAMSYPLGILARRLERKLEGERNEEDAAPEPPMPPTVGVGT
ncbi:MAG: Amino acid transporter binding protein and permease protein [Labilithrix sp.]|nr:Amino acid transporter binding protein and permease protein [Labilithrix sp.]